MDEKILKFSALCLTSSQNGSLSSLTFHSPKKKGERRKVRGTLKNISGRRVVQLESFLTEGRVTHENIPVDRIDSQTADLLDGEFGKADILFDGGSASIMISKNGKVTLIVHEGNGGSVSRDAVHGNDREKKRLLTGSERFLFTLGVSDKNGRVHDRMQSKFRQINRFCEYIVEACAHIKGDGLVRIADLCCGKSYLSFAAYYTITVVLGREAEMYCVDLKKSVIEYCASTAKSAGFDGMKFICGDISAFSPDGQIDMVISLHACDTATDVVLDKAVKLGAGVILSTPCCHRELSSNIDCPTLEFISSRPLLRQKLCTAATDALRLMRLEAAGYETDCTELIDPEDTPKNIMLRAYKKNRSEGYLREKLSEYIRAYEFMYGCGPRALPQCGELDDS